MMYETCVTKPRWDAAPEMSIYGVWGTGKGTVLSDVPHRVAFAVASILNNDKIEAA